MSQPSSARDASVAWAAPALLALTLTLAVGCSSNVQDLGRNGDGPTRVEEPSLEGGEGLGADWTMPTSPLARDLACPLTRPIEGGDCPTRNTAPCTYHGTPEDPPDTPIELQTKVIEKTTTVCMCTSSQRWRCVQGVTIRTLLEPVADGDACADPLVIERSCRKHECLGTVSCRCVGGRLRCTR